MSAAAAFFNQHATAAQSLTGKAAPMADATTGNDGSTDTSSSATISANDFLTLLVTEMQNQDPTADTDPDEYINQLVQVNSLEQLININQTLTTAFPASSTSGDAGTNTAVAQNTPAQISAGARANSSRSAAAGVPAGSSAATGSASTLLHTQGNLGMPAANAAAGRVAHALDGRTRSAAVVPSVR